MINRLFIRADTHGDFNWLPDWCKENHTTTDDVLILLGDHALRFEGMNKPRELHRKGLVAALPITIFALRGNHDRPYYKEDGTIWEDIKLTVCPMLDQRFTEGIKFYEDEMWHDEKYPNIWYFQDGREYCIKGKTFFTYGGAYSVDKEYRQLFHWTWYANEIVPHSDHCAALDIVDHRYFNYVLTHTCPYEWRPVDLFLKGIDQSKVDNTMEEYLTEILRYIGGYDHWYFGHFHADREYEEEKATMLFGDIIEITPNP